VKNHQKNSKSLTQSDNEERAATVPWQAISSLVSTIKLLLALITAAPIETHRPSLMAVN